MNRVLYQIILLYGYMHCMACWMGTPDNIFIAMQSLELLIGLKSGIRDVPGVKNGFTPARSERVIGEDFLPKNAT